MTDSAEQTNATEEATQLPSFDEMPLSDEVKAALADMGYTHPAPVQHAVYDPAVRGRDLVVQARTGTGKTAAFAIPLVDQMIKRNLRLPQALVLTPTRELALQVAREVERIGAKRGICPASVYGGAPMQRQVDAIKAGAQIIVGTPGRVLDHMRRGTLNPKELRILVLDESDEMLSMGFEKELHAIVDFMPEQRQTLLFSATLPPEIVRMASTRLHDPQFIYLSGDHVGALEILHFVYFVMQDKGDALVRMLEAEDPESALIFCNTRDETERVAGMLQRTGFDADWLNGDLPQSERETVMTRSKEGKLRFLVATDVAARGIDISHLTHVINYDFPESSEVYVHRTGRTGRMGRTGTAISLITPHDIGSLYYLRLIYKIRPFERQLPTEGELKTRAHADIITMLAEAFAKQDAHPDDVALARRLLTHDRCEHIVAGLLRSHLGDRMKAEEQAAEARRGRRPRPTPRMAEPQSPRVTARADRSRGPRPDDRRGPRPDDRRGPRPDDRGGRRGRPEPSRMRERSPEMDERPRREPVQEAPEEIVERPIQAPVKAEPRFVEPETLQPGVTDEPDDEEPDTVPPTGDEDDAAPAERRSARENERASDPDEVDEDEDEGEEELEDEDPEEEAEVQVRKAPPGLTETDLDLPAYEMTPVTEADLEAAREEVERLVGKGHASLADWTPPQEDNDDEPIFEDEDAPAPPRDEVNEEDDEDDELEVFVNVGRKDGVRPGDFIGLLTDAGVRRDDIGRIRIRDKHTFVAVRRDVIDDAIDALHGRAFGDRIANAERARPRED